MCLAQFIVIVGTQPPHPDVTNLNEKASTYLPQNSYWHSIWHSSIKRNPCSHFQNIQTDLRLICFLFFISSIDPNGKADIPDYTCRRCRDWYTRQPLYGFQTDECVGKERPRTKNGRYSLSSAVCALRRFLTKGLCSHHQLK